ncbi:AB hydrolase-1 domain-containing protein [Mycena venus]|uniref:AB hydrolase-1 domain-containing protein n=1 Tax=Mycena venus TaxID=2733690 RepID=A0A8H6YTG4_9AGAR|nr:AB hydrolase-1 domain-containing protein [Mycena venus]
MLSLAFKRLRFIALCITTAQAVSDFDWQTLTPSPGLDWKPCYSGFQCTRLTVPLDYSAPQGSNASIAIVRLPSTAPKSEYRGPILFNPGGPGGSGVDAIVENGEAFVNTFGPGFDIVGFDPRGISYSTPIISFFNTEAERRFLIPSATNIIYPSLNQSSHALSEGWADYQLLGQLALASDVGAGHYLQHMSTDNIARDMLRITEVFGFEKLQYWGISYGSVLGATFATMFPVCGHLKLLKSKLSGCCHIHPFRSFNRLTSISQSANGTSMMADVDGSLDAFFDGCHKAGPELCPFYEPTASAISAKLDALTASVHEKPIAVVTPGSHGLIDLTFLRNVILDALFDPYDSASGFVPLAQGLAHLAKGNATALYALGAIPTFECPASASAAPAFHENNLEAYIAIACGDANPVNDTLTELQEYWLNGLRVSNFSDLLSSPRVVCSGYNIHRPGRFQGPVGAKNISFPLLLVGNTLDPGTAHAGAIQTSKAFPGSVVLTQDSVGHTSLVAPSSCKDGYFREYFVNGTLPAPGTVCPIDIELFPNSTSPDASATTKRALQTVEEKRLLNAGRKIGRVVRRAVGRRAL